MTASTDTLTKTELLFREVQRFRQWWLWALLGGSLAVTVGPAAAQLWAVTDDDGSWGIRWGFKGKAHNVSGDRGVKLTFAEEKPLLIGSQRAEALAAAIAQARHSRR